MIMTQREFAIDIIKDIVNNHGENIANNRKDLYRSRMLLKPNIYLTDDTETSCDEPLEKLMLSKVIVSEFHNGIPQLAFEVSDLNWRAFSACDDEYVINIAIRLCNQYRLLEKIAELTNMKN